MMKGFSKCYHEKEKNDDVSHMYEVNKGAQKIMTEMPDQLTSLFKWVVVTTLFAVFFVTATYVLVLLEHETSERMPIPSSESLVAANRKLCSTAANVLYDRGQSAADSVDLNRMPGSKLMTLDVDPQDVHYVFVNDTHVPWLSMCSLETAVRAVGNNGRVNVFVVSGVVSEGVPGAENHSVPLSSSLDELIESYGAERLRVVHVTLEECLEYSPFRGMDLSGQPTMAVYAVQQVVLWQFGGTAINADALAVRGEVYRARGPVTEYGDKTISAPNACHAYVYDLMVNTRDYFRSKLPLDAAARRMIASKTSWRHIKRADRDNGRPVSDAVTCRGDDSVVDGDRCYYADASSLMARDGGHGADGFCPVASHASRRRVDNTTVAV